MLQMSKYPAVLTLVVSNNSRVELRRWDEQKHVGSCHLNAALVLVPVVVLTVFSDRNHQEDAWYGDRRTGAATMID